MLHDLLLGAWRRITHRAGAATAVEPAMERLRVGTGRASLEHSDLLVVLPDEGSVVTDVSVVHPVANSFLRRAAHTAGTAASARDAAKSLKYGSGGHTPLSMESYRRLGRLAMQFLQTLADAATSSATAGSDVTISSFVTGALRELSVALVKGNEVVYRKLCMCMPRCPQWTLSSVVLVVVYCVVVPNVCYCLCAVDVWLSVRPR
jgi:hypothetical protein